LREVSGTPLPQDAHTAEAHLQHGLLDNVVDRESMKPRLITLLRVLTGQKLGKGEFKPATRSRLKIGPNPEAWEAVTASRNGERPSATFYIRTILDPFVELHGDRLSGDDRSIIAGLGYLNGEPVAIIGQQRPYSLNGESYHVYPDGLRKAQRLIKLAARFELPLVTLLDTQGADPGLEAEEQGIGNAIATTLSLMAEAPVPIVSAIIGEGGNEGALALGISDRIVMQQYAIYSPISLNRTLGGSNGDPELDREAAEALMLTAQDCLELGIIDSIVPEPVGGAHTNSREAATALQNALVRQLKAVSKLSPSKLLDTRYKKFRQMGEKSAYSQEAMDREVELLLKISNAPLRPSGRGRAQRKRAPETVEAIPEAQPLPLEVD
jgi:acetyl-CoA carboxylase carboxyl transferase alpha subunit